MLSVRSHHLHHCGSAESPVCLVSCSQAASTISPRGTRPCGGPIPPTSDRTQLDKHITEGLQQRLDAAHGIVVPPARYSDTISPTVDGPWRNPTVRS